MNLKNIIQNTGTNLLTTALGLVGSVILARWLGPNQRGIFAAIILIPNVLQYFINFGLSSTTVYFTALPGSDKHKIWSSIFLVGLIQSVLGVLVGWILIRFYLPKFSEDAVHLGNIYLLTIPLGLFGMYATYLLQGASFFKITNYLKCIVPAGYCVGIITLKNLNTLSVENMVYVQIIIQTVYLFTVLAFLYKIVLRKFSLQVDFDYIRKMLNYGIKVWFGDISQLANSRIDQFLIGFFLNSKDLGIYTVAVSVAGFTSIFANAVRTIIVPTVAGQNNFVEKSSQVVLYFKNYWIFSLIFQPIFTLSVSILIPHIFGNQYVESIIISQILTIGYLFINAKTVLAGGIQAMNFPEIISIVEFIGMVISMILSYFLIQNYGLRGVAIAISFAYFGQFVGLVIFMKKKHISSFRNLFVPNYQEIKSILRSIKTYNKLIVK
ncbi:MAG: oligosaccharide flippase family protein [Arcicella sp.]|nr:oligosaccharide flippase family protein [Arcicella sp.]